MRLISLLLLVIPLSIVSGAWTCMLTVGVIRGEWLHKLPTLGYWDSLLITGAASFALFAKSIWGAIAEEIGKS